MPSCCAVANCSNVHKNNDVIHFFRFPQDKRMQKIWINQCGRSTKLNPNTSYICSVHFKQQCMDPSILLQQRLLGCKVRPKLLKDAVPTEKLPVEQFQEVLDTKDHIPLEEIFTQPDDSNKANYCKCHTEIENLQKEVQYLKETKEMLKQDQSLKTNIKVYEMQEEINKLRIEINQLKNKTVALDKKNKRYFIKNAILHKKNKILKNKLSKSSCKPAISETQVIKQECRTLLSDIFTDKQLDKILHKKKWVNWSEKDISIAFTLRYFSKRCYIFLREKLHHPLPGISTLRKWASRVIMTRGVFTGVLQLLEVAARNMSSFEKLVVLQYDEVKVLEKYEYDKVNDQIIGPHKYMQVVNARSLCGKWRQPIYADFDQKMTENILLTIIKHLHNIGLNVIACVSDCGSTNVALLRRFGVNKEKPYIIHPCVDKKIFFFADAPHLLKLIRNWLVDTGFALEDGTKISKTPLYELLQSQSEISSIFKITREHLECQNTARQSVPLAAQLLSHTVASALSFHKHENGDEFEKLGAFIETVNDWFDVMNSYVPSSPILTKCGYGKANARDAQNAVLNKMYHMVLSMRCIGKQKIMTFQEGILLSINAIKELYEELSKEYSITYILTHKLNQDALENLFSQLRGRGGLNDHPAPLDALNRLKVIVLGRTGIVQNKTNTVDRCSDEEQYIVGQVLQKTGVSVSLDDTFNDKKSDTDSDRNSLSIKHSAVQDKNAINLEEDGTEYLAGWIAHKLRLSYPQLGNYSYVSNKQTNNEHAYALPENMPNWVSHLSYGGLTVPTPEFLNETKILNEVFKKYFGEKVDFNRNITHRLTEKMLLETNLDKKIIEVYVKQRIFIRLKYLNHKLVEGRKKYYKRRSIDRCDNTPKKMKKITT